MSRALLSSSCCSALGAAAAPAAGAGRRRPQQPPLVRLTVGRGRDARARGLAPPGPAGALERRPRRSGAARGPSACPSSISAPATPATPTSPSWRSPPRRATPRSRCEQHHRLPQHPRQLAAAGRPRAARSSPADGSRAWSGGRAGRAPRRSEDLRAGRADLVLETKTAYWLLVTAREGERVLQEAIRACDAHLADARNRERFGIAARNEVLAVQVERDRVELERLRADAAAEIAEANLQRLLDLPPGARVEPGRAARGPRPPAAPEVEALVARGARRAPRAGRARRRVRRGRGARPASSALRGSRRWP